MQFAKKLIGNEEERAVSPVIGVILMVAITVILAAVIAAFVLDLGQSTGANAQAGFSFDQDGQDVTITVTSIERADTFTIDDSDVSCSFGVSGTSASVGQLASASSCGNTDGTIIITGSYNGNEAVLTEWDYNAP